MTGLEYEHHVAKYLTNHGYHGVKVTKGSGDYGVDVIAHKHGKKYAVQCKLYTGSVGLSAIQEAVAGKAMYGCDAAMVVTNSSFTKAAHELAKANGVMLIEHVRGNSSHIFPKGVRIFAWLVYLFFASAIIYATFDMVKGQTFFKATYNVVSTTAVLTSPFWIKYAIKGVWNTLNNLIHQIKMRMVKTPTGYPSAESQTVKGEIEQTADAHPVAINYPDGFRKYQHRHPQQSSPAVPPCDIVCNEEAAFETLKRIKAEHEDVYIDLYDVFMLGVKQGYLSTSIVQRHMKWGYVRAVRMLDAMETLCFIAPLQGNTPRKLLVTEQEVVNLIAKVEADT